MNYKALLGTFLIVFGALFVLLVYATSINNYASVAGYFMMGFGASKW